DAAPAWRNRRYKRADWRKLGAVAVIRRKTRLFASVAMARSTAEEIARNLTSAYRGDSDGTLRRKIEAPVAVMLSSVTSYLGALDDSFDDAGKVDQDALGDLRRSAANDAIDSWAGGLDAH